jgi:hypothetical protein
VARGGGDWTFRGAPGEEDELVTMASRLAKMLGMSEGEGGGGGGREREGEGERGGGGEGEGLVGGRVEQNPDTLVTYAERLLLRKVMCC